MRLLVLPPRPSRILMCMIRAEPKWMESNDPWLLVWETSPTHTKQVGENEVAIPSLEIVEMELAISVIAMRSLHSPSRSFGGGNAGASPPDQLHWCKG